MWVAVKSAKGDRRPRTERERNGDHHTEQRSAQSSCEDEPEEERGEEERQHRGAAESRSGNSGTVAEPPGKRDEQEQDRAQGPILHGLGDERRDKSKRVAAPVGDAEEQQ